MARWRFNPRKSFPLCAGVTLNIGEQGIKHTVTAPDTRFKLCSGQEVHSVCVLPCNTLHSVKLNNNQLDEMLFLFSLHFKSSKIL